LGILNVIALEDERGKPSWKKNFKKYA